MKNLRIVASCLLHGAHLESGTVMTADDAVATDLIANGRAVIINDPTTVETRDPQPEDRDPKPGKKRKK